MYDDSFVLGTETPTVCRYCNDGSNKKRSKLEIHGMFDAWSKRIVKKDTD